ncbi:MAG TPA: TlpA disulfide reductase family protein [Candidatus Limnocylindrales bacterium]|nr:TlpA disulfide reductase family protein [Candidatus Limnocylindrales bacterium]
MLKKIIVRIFILILVSGIALLLLISGSWSVIKGPLSEVKVWIQQTTENRQGTTDKRPAGLQVDESQAVEVETLLASAEEDLFVKAGVQKFKEKIEAPDFTLKNLEGQEVSLKEFRGKLVFLNFWATWCGPCRAEKPTIEKLYQEFKDKGLIVLAISVDQGDSAHLVQSYMEEHKLSYQALLDPEQRVAKAYAVRGIPVTYLIDPEGFIIGAAMGARLWDKDEPRKLIAHLLEKPEK